MRAWVIFMPVLLALGACGGFFNLPAENKVEAEGSTSFFSASWSMEALSDGLYTYSTNLVQFVSGVAELIGSDQTDDDNTAAGFAGGNLAGVVWDTNRMKLGDAGGCDGTLTNCSELHESWTPQWANLVHYWKFNNSWNQRVGSSSCSPLNAAQFSTDAKLGSHSAELNGINQAVNCGTGTYLSNLTISAWIKLNSTPSGTHFIVARNEAAPWRHNFFFRITSGTLNFGFYNGSGYPQISGTTTSWIPGKWYQVAVTVSGTTGALYIDGRPESQTGGLSGVPSSAGNTTLGIGANVAESAYYFDGAVDDVAIWNSALTPSEMLSIYDRQSAGVSARYGGLFTSRVMDAFTSAASWTTLSWVPTLPFFKELPNHSGGIQNETSASYSSLVGSTGATGANDLMNNLIGYWPLNETAPGTAPGATDVSDKSGNDAHGTLGGNSILGAVGKFSNAITLDGAGDFITIYKIYTLSSKITIAAWYRLNSGGEGDLVSMIDAAATDYRSISVDDTGFIRGWPDGSPSWATYVVSGTSANYKPGEWNHAAFTIDEDGVNTQLTVFINGSQVATRAIALRSGFLTSGSVYIGRANNGAHDLEGSIDEVALWNRALHANEIKQLYQRGASRLKYQVRSCATNPCTTETWQGPDGTIGTYFSELNNNTVALDGSGDVKAALPSMLFSDFTSPPGAKRYFQYRTIFETDSSDVALGPELKSVTVDPLHYPSEAAIHSNNGVSFTSLSTFAQTLGAGGCASGIGYNLSLDKTNWKYWNGSTWAGADGTVAQSNTASVIHANTATFGSQVGTGAVYFKAFLQSSGTSKCELDNIQVDGTR